MVTGLTTVQFKCAESVTEIVPKLSIFIHRNDSAKKSKDNVNDHQLVICFYPA